MRCIVTGGAGFIGSHLVDRLLLEGHQVIVIDDLSEGKLDNLPMANPDLRVFTDSITNTASAGGIDRCFQRIDVVFHLAALPRPQYSVREPVKSAEVNVSGTLNVLEHCFRHGVDRLVFASSASIYGEQHQYPSWEHSPPHPMTPYSLHKLIGEQYCQLFGDLYGLEWNALRFFNVYGPRMNPWGEYASVIPKFIAQLQAGERPVIFGTGEQKRDFVHVYDVVDALVRAATSPVWGEVFNIGSGVNYSIRQVFEIVRDELGADMEPDYGPAQVEPEQTLASNRKADWKLGWRPKIELVEGIEQLCSYSSVSITSRV